MYRNGKHRIVVLPGDGIGPEVMQQAIDLLKALEGPLGMHFEFEEHAVGGEAIRRYGVPIQAETIEKCKQADAVLLGAVGHPDFDREPPERRPERALLALRAQLGVYCNLRPIWLFDALLEASTLKSDIVKNIDFLVVRELTGGLYFGQPAGLNGTNGHRRAVNTMAYSEPEIRRITRKAFELARVRRCKLTSVDKANVLAVSQLWRQVVEEVAAEYPDVRVEHMLVDNCAMQLIRQPRQFDVILTENMFGDILSDEASMLTGSIGMLPSASLGDGPALYEPVHGSAPDIAGTGRANPIAMMLSVAMMLKYTYGRPLAAAAIEDAVSTILTRGYHTPDLHIPGGKVVGTDELGRYIIQETVHSFSTNYLAV